MWLLPVFSTTARLALRLFYRFRVSGERVPADGPVLLVANHPNSLLDPAAVVAVAGRPVRFLAKAPLFSDRQVGWLVRGAGAIPVYRRSDDPALMERNRESFDAVFEALREGAAVGIFPEGISHSEPSLAPLRTGAARIALGAADGAGPFPIVPIGLSLRDKGRFRSEALALIGEPVRWAELAARGPDDAGAVRDLTARIEEALRTVTVNLQRWEDAPLVEYAQEIYLAGEGIEVTPAMRVRGAREVAEGLSRLRSEGGEWRELVREVRAHGRVLRALGLRPHQLPEPTRSDALRWTLRNLLLLPPAFAVQALGALVFLVPFLATAALERLARPGPDVRATYKLLVGSVAYLVWTLLLVALAGWTLGWGAALLALVAVPALGLATVALTDWTAGAGAVLRRFVVRRRRPELVAELAARQRRLARRLAELRAALRG